MQDALKEITLVFSRDETISSRSAYQTHKQLSQEEVDKLPPEVVQSYSQPHVLPFSGLAIYHAPMCYLYTDRVVLYSMCRSAFMMIWCRLNVVSSDDGTILSLCQCFEGILMELQPKLFLHLVRIGLHPLRVVFPWIHQGFANILEVDELLQLWDRIFGFMDTYLLPVLAAAIFIVRSEPLFQVNKLYYCIMPLAVFECHSCFRNSVTISKMP